MAVLAAMLGSGACASDAGDAPGAAAAPMPARDHVTEPPDAPETSRPAAPPAVPAPSLDEMAGVRARDVPQRGTGELVAVAGSVPAPGGGSVRTVRVEVEGGLPIDAPAFADFVMATLNDERGWRTHWGHDAATTFARTGGEAELHVVLASPDTSEELCRPLDTGGTLSCRTGPQVVITHHRWVHGHPDYVGNSAGYRQYVINHEVGHFLGRSHVDCPGEGLPAPVMQQQTFGLDGCAQNPWPYP